jgi:tRNA-2-methylthio-N6-dimethylallyladenosine synthase
MPGRVYLETFGCQMNELDSELVAGQLRTLGYRFVASSTEADVVLYNTCSVREHAEQKVWSRLGEMRVRKETDPTLVVGVLGCMAERDGEKLMDRMPVVDILCGPGELDKLPSLLDNAVRTRRSLAHELAQARERGQEDADAIISARQVALQGSTSRRSATLSAAQDTLELLDLSRAITPRAGTRVYGAEAAPTNAELADGDDAPGAARRSAYVRITRGCNKFCTYCVVPFTRGAEVHRPPEHIIDECKRLADAGVIEVTLLGQTVNHYRFEHGAAVTVGGVVQPQKGRSYQGGHRRDPFAGDRVTTFADLLRRIHDEVPAIARLRFVTSYPRDFGDDVLEVIRDHPRICRYMHVPAQSGSDRILQLMNRGYTVGEYKEFLARLRSYLHEPHKGRPVTISSDFIVGFPTETDADFEATMQLVREERFKNSFIFKYSPRPGTVAIDKFVDDVPDNVKRTRNNSLLTLQNTIAHEVSQEAVGGTFDCMVEGLSRATLKKAGKTGAQLRSAGQVAITVGGRTLSRGMSALAEESSDGASCSSTRSEALAPDVDDELPTSGTVQLAARTDTDLIVFLDVPADRAEAMVGTMQRAKIVSATNLALRGELVPTP